MEEQWTPERFTNSRRRLRSGGETLSFISPSFQRTFCWSALAFDLRILKKKKMNANILVKICFAKF